MFFMLCYVHENIEIVPLQHCIMGTHFNAQTNETEQNRFVCIVENMPAVMENS